MDMSKYAAYQTNKRKFDDRGGRGDDDKRPRMDKKPKAREGREPPLDIYIDQNFNYWNLPVKARVLLISNVPQAICQPDLLFNLFSFFGDVERIKILRQDLISGLSHWFIIII